MLAVSISDVQVRLSRRSRTLSDRFRVDTAKGLIDVCVGTVALKHILYINVVLPAPFDPRRSSVRPGVSFFLPVFDVDVDVYLVR